MVILDWTKPGVWIEGLDEDAAWRISGQIERLEDAILEANVTLNMFDQARASDQAMERHKEEFETRMIISSAVKAELFPDGMTRMGMPNGSLSEEYAKRKVIVDTEVRHRMWQRGFLPRSLLSKPKFIFAKAFIHALDLFDKFLGDIAKDPDAPANIKDIYRDFGVSLPDLRGIRNSIQHAEDRSKGEHYGKKIDLKKVDKTKMSIDGAVIVMSGLDGNKFGTTMSDGHYGAVDVSVQTLDVLRNTLLEVYSAFKWRGGERLYPS